MTAKAPIKASDTFGILLSPRRLYRNLQTFPAQSGNYWTLRVTQTLLFCFRFVFEVRAFAVSE